MGPVPRVSVGGSPRDLLYFVSSLRPWHIVQVYCDYYGMKDWGGDKNPLSNIRLRAMETYIFVLR